MAENTTTVGYELGDLSRLLNPNASVPTDLQPIVSTETTQRVKSKGKKKTKRKHGEVDEPNLDNLDDSVGDSSEDELEKKKVTLYDNVYFL